jgi:hypothetical protein
VEAIALHALELLGREFLGSSTRVIHKLSEDHCAGRGKRSAGPPKVKGGRVAVPDRLLASGLSVDRFQRQSYLDQLALYFLDLPCPRWWANLAADAT